MSKAYPPQDYSPYGHGSYPPAYGQNTNYPPTYGQQSNYPPQGHPHATYYAGSPQEAHVAPVVVVHQAPYRPSNYLLMAITSCIYCCFICGSVAIYMAVSSSQHADRGDLERAANKGRNARNWSIAAIVTGFVIIVVMIILGATGVFYFGRHVPFWVIGR